MLRCQQLERVGHLGTAPGLELPAVWINTPLADLRVDQLWQARTAVYANNIRLCRCLSLRLDVHMGVNVKMCMRAHLLHAHAHPGCWMNMRRRAAAAFHLPVCWAQLPLTKTLRVGEDTMYLNKWKESSYLTQIVLVFKQL